jgi:radical SAM protein with 4Fe4S-binding SPASM domain
MTYSPFRHFSSVLWKRNPIHLTFFVTGRCNARCPFCFYLSPKNEAVRQERELTLDEIARLSASLGNLLWLAFSGGEIFLRSDLVEITRIFYRQNRPAIILLPTNGLKTRTIREYTEKILAECPKSTIVVKLSLDGPEPIHDRIRGVAGSYRKTMATYESLAGLLAAYPNFEFGINSVFCAENQDVMDDLIETVARLPHIKTHTVSLIRGAVADDTLKEVNLRKYATAIAKLEANLKHRTGAIYRFSGARIKAAQDILQRRLIHATSREQQAQLPCYAGRLNLVLGESGDLYPCESFTPCFRFGNVREHDYNIGKLLTSPRARQILADIKKSCFCTHECYMMTNILFNPRLYPALLREYLQLAGR